MLLAKDARNKSPDLRSSRQGGETRGGSLQPFGCIYISPSYLMSYISRSSSWSINNQCIFLGTSVELRAEPRLQHQSFLWHQGYSHPADQHRSPVGPDCLPQRSHFRLGLQCAGHVLQPCAEWQCTILPLYSGGSQQQPITHVHTRPHTPVWLLETTYARLPSIAVAWLKTISKQEAFWAGRQTQAPPSTAKWRLPRWKWITGHSSAF